MTNWETNAEIIRGQKAPDNPYFRKVFDFANSWVRGQEEFVLQTSGSTGVPKAIVITRDQLISSARMTGSVLGLGRGTRALACLNVDYIAGMMMIVRGMELGWKLTVTEPSGNPLLLLDENCSFDFVAMVPAQLGACLDESLTHHRVSSLGTILLGGAPVNKVLQHKLEKLTQPVYQSYGMTETVSHIALRRLNGYNVKDEYVVLPGIIIGQDDRGCLFAIGEVTGQKKIQTNDLIELTATGTFRWVGRADNVINSGGVKIILDKLDQTIAGVFVKLDYTALFFAWYEIDEKWGQKLILLVEGEEADFNVSQLLAEIRKHVSVYETPKHVYFVNRFARTSTDKIDKRVTAASLLHL